MYVNFYYKGRGGRYSVPEGGGGGGGGMAPAGRRPYCGVNIIHYGMSACLYEKVDGV